jgi:hypothetical protein
MATAATATLLATTATCTDFRTAFQESRIKLS